MSSEFGVQLTIGARTNFIISTSGRASSLLRYRNLLQKILKLDVAYIPIHDGTVNAENGLDIVDPLKFVNLLRALPCIGGAISKDIKQAVIPYLDEIDESAELVNSVNTVIRTGNILKGYNTDALGFEAAILKGMAESNISIKAAVCYGYGGVASVVISILKKLGIECYLAGRQQERVDSRSRELKVSPWTSSQAVDLFVNATPASEQPLTESFIGTLQDCKIAFDHEMPGSYLRSYCDEHGIHHIAGTEMYYPQMYAQWSLFLSNNGVDPATIPDLLKQAEVYT